MALHDPPRAGPRHSSLPDEADDRPTIPQPHRAPSTQVEPALHHPGPLHLPGATALPPSAQRSRARLALTAVASGLMLGLAAILFLPVRAAVVHGAISVPTPVAPVMALERAAPAEPEADTDAEEVVEERADVTFSRARRSPISGGLLAIPSTFSSTDGTYDLVLHFHGESRLVEESFTHAGLNAVVGVVNLGVGSGGYEEQFGVPWGLPTILAQTQEALEKRGLRGAKLRRLALSAFSAGYAAVRRILDQPALADQVDAVLLLDGIHVNYSPRDHSMNLERIASFERFARQAALGKKLFWITHSEIIPNGPFASTHQTTDKLLELVGVTRTAGGEAPAIPELAWTRGRPMQQLVPLSKADAGELHVRGYAGDQKDDHMMHLLQMSATAVPELVRYWSRGAER
jgi:hypothetical protein